ncbi:Hypothetical predicted protein [Podarcis lilfordi]|uniref:Uncharacterized protein n=1 Tax=Podarcis lilfordi TaxID=74358 RepID=A0AA35KYS1_9SAUR|nr:Hypothetical predicted protein [Podarcis lilfordi]
MGVAISILSGARSFKDFVDRLHYPLTANTWGVGGSVGLIMTHFFELSHIIFVLPKFLFSGLPHMIKRKRDDSSVNQPHDAACCKYAFHIMSDLFWFLLLY